MANHQMVNSFSVLTKLDRSDEAMKLLKAIAKLVRPIMESHRWQLPLLAEFWPEKENLLGVNCSSNGKTFKICLRLRYSHSINSFYDMQQDLIPTMLHELTHFVRGPHDDIFNKILDGLQDEFDALQRKGYTGDGFDVAGTRLGGNMGRGGMDEGRRIALERLDEQARKSRLMGRGGRLGGSVNLDPRQAAANAAERRAKGKLRKGCGDMTDPKTQGEVKKAQVEGKIEVIDLTNLSDDDDDWMDIKTIKQEPGLDGLEEKPEPIKKLTSREKKPKKKLEESDDEIFIVESSFKPAKKKKSVKAVKEKSSSASPPPKKLRTIERKPSENYFWKCRVCDSTTESMYWVCRVCHTMKAPGQ